MTVQNLKLPQGGSAVFDRSEKCIYLPDESIEESDPVKVLQKAKELVAAGKGVRISREQLDRLNNALLKVSLLA